MGRASGSNQKGGRNGWTASERTFAPMASVLAIRFPVFLVSSWSAICLQGDLAKEIPRIMPPAFCVASDLAALMATSGSTVGAAPQERFSAAISQRHDFDAGPIERSHRGVSGEQHRLSSRA